MGIHIAAVLCLLAAGAARGGEPRVDYDREVMPILSDNCYKCHGPDAESRKAQLRFDTKDGAFRVKDGKRVIVPGNAAASELVRRISSHDPDQMMPPPKSLRKLTPKQITLLTRWVTEGAKWGVHWSLVPPRRPPLPQVRDASWVRNEIDRFVLARLEKQGLKPRPEADKSTLLRRVTFDLTGLPPTPKELDDFIHDTSPDAYEKVVDRLLASPRYGERMAAIWLDLARYADTNGYQMDRYRPMWPYRDWVIKAFNENLPYDQFVAWQLAGDLLPHATKEQRLATAFNRLHMQNEEGGIVAEEFRVAYVVDCVDTFGTAFLGLTFECSRCHDHKFDPITQKDFYSLFAFFQNIDESGQTSYFTNSMPVPTLLLSTDEQDRKIAELRGRIAAKRKELQAARDRARPAFETWLNDRGELKEPSGAVGAFSFDAMKDGKIANAADSAKPGHAVEGPKLVEGKFGKAAALSGDNGFTFPGIGHFTRADPFSLSIWLKAPVLEERMVVIHHSKAPVDAGSRGYELLLENGHVALGLHHMWPGNSLKVVSEQAVPANQWTHVAATYDGSSKAAGVRIYIDGRPARLRVVRDNLYKDITYTHDGGEPDLAIGFRFRDSGFKDGRVDDFRIFDRALTALEISQLAHPADAPDAWSIAAKKLSDAQRGELFDYFVSQVNARTIELAGELHALRRQQDLFIEPIPEAMVMQELPHPKPAYVLKRGAYDAHGEQVWANTPAALPPMTRDEPKNRLGLARWLFDKDQPLTARVAVNRAWQQMFGRGIVETSDNFGSQGSPPTHPELLDWLACEFRDGPSTGSLRQPPFDRLRAKQGEAGQSPSTGSGQSWDMKRLLKTIAMSATYRQSSKADPELLASDPDNRLLARGLARRLTAEMLRDQALADSGLLVEKLGGPSVKPYQPDGVWDVAMGHPAYDQGHGADLHRRSLYTYWKRSVPPPAMLTFDASDRNYCVARRQSTSTPLQALTLLNDTQIVEAARLISQRMIEEGGPTPDRRIAWAWRLITSRPPTGRELAILKEMFDEQREIFAKDLKSADALLNVGEATNDPSLNKLDLAAGAVLAEAILNHDAAMMRR